MKKVLQASLLAVALLIGSNVSAQDSPIEIGVKAGANLSNIGGDMGDLTKTKFGFNVGLTFDYNFTPNIALLTGVEFTTKGAKIKFIDENMNASFIQVPVHVGYKLPVSDAMKIVFHAGPYAAVGVAGKTKIDGVKLDTFGDNGILKRFDFGLGLGAGIEYGKICAGLGWDFGLLDLGKYDATARTQNGYLSVGYKF